MTCITRRALFPLASAAGLAACSAISTKTVNGVTTVTVDVAQVAAWGQAFVNGAQLVAGLPGISGTPQAALVMGVMNIAATDLAAFQRAAGSAVSLTFDATSAPAAITSLLNDGSTLLADAQATLGNVAAAQMQMAQTYVNAIRTIVSLFAARMGKAAAVQGGTPMAERDALTVLRVR